jgi:Flp pilus assembly pilin Flp
MRFLATVLRSAGGAAVIEYGLIAALIGLAAAAAIATAGPAPDALSAPAGITRPAP